MFATAKRCVRRAPSDDSDHQIMSPRSGSAHGKKCVPPLRKRCCRLSLRPASSGSHAGAPSGMADAVAHPHIEPGHARGSDCLKSKLPKIEADTVVMDESRVRSVPNCTEPDAVQKCTETAPLWYTSGTVRSTSSALLPACDLGPLGTPPNSFPRLVTSPNRRPGIRTRDRQAAVQRENQRATCTKSMKICGSDWLMMSGHHVTREWTHTYGPCIHSWRSSLRPPPLMEHFVRKCTGLCQKCSQSVPLRHRPVPTLVRYT